MLKIIFWLTYTELNLVDHAQALIATCVTKDYVYSK